jgi:hypothetical protein
MGSLSSIGLIFLQYEVVYGFRPSELLRFTRKPRLPEHVFETFEDFIGMRKNDAEATFHMIHTDFYKRQDLRWYQNESWNATC